MNPNCIDHLQLLDNTALIIIIIMIIIIMIEPFKQAASRLYGDGRKLAILLRNRWFILYKSFRLKLV